MRRTGPKMIKQLVVLVTGGVFLFLSGCITASGTPDLIAENNFFNRTYLRVAPGEEVSMVFENKDNTTHNLAVYEDREATQVIFRGEALQGPGTITYNFTAPEEPGNYHFQCDFHPSEMNGRFVVFGTGS